MILVTLFDTIQGLQASTLDSTQLETLCEKQRILTMHRIADWLRGNAKIFQFEWDTSMARELKDLAEDLDYLADFTEP